jgi:hypothetical protein
MQTGPSTGSFGPRKQVDRSAEVGAVCPPLRLFTWPSLLWIIRTPSNLCVSIGDWSHVRNGHRPVSYPAAGADLQVCAPKAQSTMGYVNL